MAYISVRHNVTKRGGKRNLSTAALHESWTWKTGISERSIRSQQASASLQYHALSPPKCTHPV